MKTNWIVAGTAWSGIVALAWWLANARIDLSCGHQGGTICYPDQVATRDNVLIWGLMVPLALFVLLTIAGRAQIGQLNLRWPRRQSTSRELVPQDQP